MKIILAFAFILSFGFTVKPTQFFNTSLTVTVRDELGNTVEGAMVKIFSKEDDYTKEKNAVEEGTTDAKGIVKFKKLNPEAYFILCRKGDKDNAGGGEKIGALKKGEFNKVTVVIQ
ncbi:MAG: SpaA isopeptide-forming pilin-related protein [Cyclobacteriaceae bacterium]